MDWASLYPAYALDQDASAGQPNKISKSVEVADIGCGFGGLLMALSPVIPDTLLLGKSMEPLPLLLGPGWDASKL